MITLAIVTLSDRSSRGEREDLSGPEIKSWAEKNGGFSIVTESVIPDDRDLIEKELIRLCDEGIMLILTTGGTGFSPRDVTPEATLAVVTRVIPGFTEAIRMKSLEKTPHAMLSRAVAGIRDRSIIINLPGSPRAVREGLEVIEKAVVHGIHILNSTVTDCGSV
jgi:molybdenum cofactor synthesis domain-containing protein